MNVQQVKISLLGLPERYRMALLQLPPSATKEDAKVALERTARRQLFEEADRAGDQEILAAREALSRGVGATLDEVRKSEVDVLVEKSKQALATLGELDHRIERNTLRREEASCRGRVGHESADVRRARGRWVRLRMAVAGFLAAEAGLAVMLAVSLSGISSYPDARYIPATIWTGVGVLTAGLVLSFAVGPVAAAHWFHGTRVAPWVSKLLVGASAGVVATSLLAVALVRLTAAIHAHGTAADLAMAVFSLSATFTVAVAVCFLEVRALRAGAVFEKLDLACRAANAEALALETEREALAAEREALVDVIDAPNTARRRFADRLVTARRDQEREKLIIEEIAGRGVAVYSMMLELSSAGREHLATIFRIVDIDPESHTSSAGV